MFKARRILAVIVLFLFVVIMGSCGGGGESTDTQSLLAKPSTQGDISQYSAGDIEDPAFNGVGIDEDVRILSSQNRTYNLVETQGVCDPEGIGYKNFCKHNCTEWVAKRRDEKGNDPVIWRGNGGEWLENAKALGYETGNIPKVGAIAVFKLSYDPCPGEDSCTNKALYEYGHVAYVESVNGDEWCISEYNYLNQLTYNERCFSAINKPPTLIGFIYNLQTSPDTDSDSPSTPTQLIGNAISSNRINLSWTTSTDNVGVAGYKIFRNGSYLKSVPTDFTSDTGLSPSTQYCYTVSAYDAVGNESSQSSQACVTTTPSSGSVEAFGTYLGKFNGVAAYSNGTSIYYCPDDDQYTLDECRNYVDNKYTGIKWQCVEYVRRYYLIVYGMNLYVGYMDAKDFYDKASDMDLNPYPNGEAIPPQIGDILISEGAPLGHVAIVKSVYNNHICTIQQNYYLNNSDGTNVCLTLTLLNGKYTVGSFSPNYPIKGWLRNPSLRSNTLPTATITSPSDGDSYTQGQSIAFSGSGYDAEDGILSAGALLWTSSIDGQIGTGTSFTKNDLSLGAHTITLIATDSKGKSGNVSVKITLTVATSLTITTNSLSDGTVNISYGTNLSASGGKETYSWSILSGTLPPGLSMSTGGIISGTPTTAGTYTFTAKVTDSSSPQQEAQKTLTIVVNPSATGGVLSVTPSDRLDSSGTEGGPFSPSSKTYTLSNTGGSSINWTASKTQNWLSLSQTSGTLAAGRSTTVTVTINSNANSFTPNTYVDIVTFTNTTNGDGNTTRTVNLTVNYSTPTITIGPTSLNFGDVQVGTCSTAVFAIQHVLGTGIASGTVGASPNPPFSITSGSSFSVSDGSAANVSVRFCPTSAGTFTGTAAVSSSATFTGTDTVTLTGTGFNPTPTTGTIQVNAILNGSSWSGSVNYTLTGPGTLNGTSVPANFSSQLAGTWSLTYNSGGPTGAILSSISPSTSQNLSGGGSITFTLTFTSSTPVERITNGSFSSGMDGWVLQGSDFWAGTELTNYNTPPGYAAGGVDYTGAPKNGADGAIYQTVTIPSNATYATLSFWYNITSDEPEPVEYDYLYVTIRDSIGNFLANVATLSNTDEGTLGVYSQKTFDMTPYIGQTIRVRFGATTDSGYYTVFRIDDVSLISDGD